MKMNPKMKMTQKVTLTAAAQLTPNWKSHQMSNPEIEFDMKKCDIGTMHVHVCGKDKIFRQRRLNHTGMG